MAMVFSLILVLNLQPDPPNKITSLIGDLESKDLPTRINASRKLAGFGAALPNEAIDPLIELVLTDFNDEAKINALDALKGAASKSDEITSKFIAAIGSDDHLPITFAARSALVYIGKPAVTLLIIAFKSRKKTVSRNAIANVLGRIGPNAKAAVPALEEEIKAGDRWERFLAAEAIVKIDPQNKSVIGVLTDSLKEWPFRAAASCARSAFLRTPEVLTILSDEIKDPKSSFQNATDASLAIAEFGLAAKPAVPVLEKKMQILKYVPQYGVIIAGTIVKIDRANKGALELLKEHREILEAYAKFKNDRVYSEFAQDILDNVMKEAPGKTKGKTKRSQRYEGVRNYE